MPSRLYSDEHEEEVDEESQDSEDDEEMNDGCKFLQSLNSTITILIYNNRGPKRIQR